MLPQVSRMQDGGLKSSRGNDMFSPSANSSRERSSRIMRVSGAEKGHDMSSGFQFVLAIMLAAFSVAAQTEVKPAAGAGAELPSADEVVERYAKAVGGREAYEKLSSRISKGTFELPAMGATGSIEIHAKTPNKTISIIDIPGFGTIARSYDGTTAWSQDPQTGIRELTGQELAIQKRGADFFQAVKLKELYPKRELKGKEKVGEREAYLVEALPSEGGPVKMYFDTESGLLTKVQLEVESPQGRLDVQTTLGDYTEVDGIKLPFTMRQAAGALEFVIKLQEVKQTFQSMTKSSRSPRSREPGPFRDARPSKAVKKFSHWPFVVQQPFGLCGMGHQRRSQNLKAKSENG